jgi:hypothetical protein
MASHPADDPRRTKKGHPLDALRATGLFLLRLGKRFLFSRLHSVDALPVLFRDTLGFFVHMIT